MVYVVKYDDITYFNFLNNFQKIETFFVFNPNNISRTTTTFQMATMKKAAKAAAVAKGTYYECVWCGKEGTDSRYTSEVTQSVCGRMVAGKTNCFCSAKCRHICCVEANRRNLLNEIDKTNASLDVIKRWVGFYLETDRKIDPVLLQVAKAHNIYKKMLTLILSGDKPSARKLYDEKKETITDCAEDVLANKKWEYMYMVILNSFAEAEDLLNGDFSL